MILSVAFQKLRKIALSYPETREGHPWGHSAFKVRGKTFLFVGLDEAGLGLSVKLKDSNGVALQLPFTEPTHYGLGQHGWVSAKFKPRKSVPVPLLEEWIEESFRAIAPKAIVRRLDEPVRSKGRKK